MLVSDGDVQEPICLGSAALFGQWGLGRLIAYYDSNKIQLAGPTCRVDCVDYKALFESMHWQVIEIDGHDHEQIRSAIKAGQAETAKPTLIIGNTTMAKGCATWKAANPPTGRPCLQRKSAPPRPSSDCRTRSSTCPKTCSALSAPALRP